MIKLTLHYHVLYLSKNADNYSLKYF